MHEASPPEGEAREGAARSSLFGKVGGLRRLAVRAAAFEMGGYAASQVIRLGSNMILSRLLFPEAFGLVALVNIFNTALQMLSDVGIRPAVVQNPRGDEPAFLNTAWTVQVMRGFMLYGVALIMAWPLAAIYREPQLSWLICAGSASVLLQGLNSTSLFTLQRKLALGTTAAIEIGSQVASVVVMITWAYFHRSVWALVGGLLTGAAFRMVASHVVDVGYRNRLHLEREARSAIFGFGKWIFASSAVHFAGQQGDRILLGRFMGVAELGIYSIAVFLSEAVKAAVTGITAHVLFPIFSRVHEQGTAKLRDTYYRARLALDALSLPALGILTMLGPWVVHLLYDKRYAEAGWMLQAFAARVAMGCVLAACETCLFSTGQARYGLYENIARLVWVAIGVPLGFHFLGLRGIVYATALSELPVFFALWPPFHAAGMLRPLLELRAASFYGAGLAAGWLLSLVLHP
jgi:O-antigen/teichoic acid export membrane protein